MSDENKNYDAPISGHEYDGIQELDNPLPTWWMVTFFATIIFGFLYWLHYDITGQGLTTSEELAQDLAEVEQMQKESGGGSEKLDVKALLANTDEVNKGMAIFTAKCAACHGNAGQGLIGPNLTDRHWLRGKGQVDDIVHTIQKGVIEKGMPPWETQMSPSELASVSAYVFLLRKSPRTDGKGPEGEAENPTVEL